ncbi:MAG: hypothetical protein WAJ87_01900, partial [Bryobacteraceae bacterium]
QVAFVPPVSGFPKKGSRSPAETPHCDCDERQDDKQPVQHNQQHLLNRENSILVGDSKRSSKLQNPKETCQRHYPKKDKQNSGHSHSRSP